MVLLVYLAAIQSKEEGEYVLFLFDCHDKKPFIKFLVITFPQKWKALLIYSVS